MQNTREISLFSLSCRNCNQEKKKWLSCVMCNKLKNWVKSFMGAHDNSFQNCGRDLGKALAVRLPCFIMTAATVAISSGIYWKKYVNLWNGYSHKKEYEEEINGSKRRVSFHLLKCRGHFQMEPISSLWDYTWMSQDIIFFT
jgi:hypothetical protein